MNYRTLTGLSLVLMFVCTLAKAQETSAPLREPDRNKPALFTDLPASMSFTPDSSVFTSATGKIVNVGFSDKTLAKFEGKVISVASRYNDRIQSIVIRSSKYNGATITITSTMQDDGTKTYSGRIISFQHSDAYELQRKGNQYSFVRKNLYDLMNE